MIHLLRSGLNPIRFIHSISDYCGPSIWNSYQIVYQALSLKIQHTIMILDKNNRIPYSAYCFNCVHYLCPVLENLLPKDFWKWWLLPSVKNFDGNAGFRNSVEFSKIFYSLIGLNKAKCSLIDDKIFFCICSQLSHQDICIPQIIDYRYGIWIQLIGKIIALIEYNIKQWCLISLTRHIE